MREQWSSVVTSHMQPHESISKMAEIQESNRTKVLISIRQPPQSTARLPNADQWHHVTHSTELNVNSYLTRINTYTRKQLGPASQYRMEICNIVTESFIFCPAKANSN